MEKKKPNGYWIKQLCQIEANKYTTRREFQRNSSSAYNACHKNKWLNELCKHMIIFSKSMGHWSKENCQIEALKYATKKEFRKKSISAYSVCHKNGWIKEFCSHMVETRKSSGYWTKELCQIEANKYSTKVEFQKNSGSAYGVCHKNGWIKEFCSHMGRPVSSKLIWIKENCKIEALKYNSRTEFSEKSSGAYNACKKNDWLDELCLHMGRPVSSKLIWIKENCKIEALKYNSRTEFKKSSSGVYRASIKNGWLDEICSHMIEFQKPKGYWTKEKCQIKALKYNTKKEFGKNFSTAYGISIKNGWLDEICSHMIEFQKPKGYWTKEKCKEEALKYNSRTEFSKKFGGAYSFSKKNGWLDEICSHMIEIQKPNGYWTKELCWDEALKCNTKPEFRKKFGGAYSFSKKNGWLDEICSHMKIVMYPSEYWIKENCKIEALKYKTVGQFSQNSRHAYNASIKNDWFYEVTSHMETPKKNSLTQYIEGWIYGLISPNGEIYIGMSTNLKKRLNAYRLLRCKSQPKLYISILEHGYSNFKEITIKYINYSFKRNELSKLERYYIKEYDTFINGLNSNAGGA